MCSKPRVQTQVFYEQAPATIPCNHKVSRVLNRHSEQLSQWYPPTLQLFDLKFFRSTEMLKELADEYLIILQLGSNIVSGRIFQHTEKSQRNIKWAKEGHISINNKL